MSECEHVDLNRMNWSKTRGKRKEERKDVDDMLKTNKTKKTVIMSIPTLELAQPSALRPPSCLFHIPPCQPVREAGTFH